MGDDEDVILVDAGMLLEEAGVGTEMMSRGWDCRFWGIGLGGWD